MNTETGWELGADLSTRKKVEKNKLTRIPLKESQEYIGWRNILASHLRWRGRSESIFKLEILLLNCSA
jgi:hypothetical protein